MLVILTLIIPVIWLLYLCVSFQYRYWSKRGIIGPKPKLFLGNITDALRFKKSLFQIHYEIYCQYPHLPYVGIYNFLSPSLLLRDNEIIKNVLNSQFSSFSENKFFTDIHLDPLFGRNPFVLKGEAWKTHRSYITSSLTSGKVKSYIPVVCCVAERMIDYINVENKIDTQAAFSATELCQKFTTENVANCCFGINAQTFEDQDQKFLKMTQTISGLSALENFKILLMFTSPLISKLLRFSTISSAKTEELVYYVTEILKYRTETSTTRNDFLDMMRDIPKLKGEEKFTIIDTVAHCVGFLIDGGVTSSIALLYCLYELAEHPQHQEKLKLEIDSTLHKYNGEITYDAIQYMTYLDAVLNESLRLHPPFPFYEKVCTKECALKGDGDKDLLMEKGCSVIIPVYAIHRDRRYYQDPKTFRPERFREDNIQNGTFIPFGDGPRICAGRKFGIFQVKIGVIYLVKKFLIEVDRKTERPVQCDPSSILSYPKNQIWLNFKSRN